MGCAPLGGKVKRSTFSFFPPPEQLFLSFPLNITAWAISQDGELGFFTMTRSYQFHAQD
jgi:hypothetical protein